MTVGMGVMVHSFESTVRNWIDTSFRADLYVSPMGSGGASLRHRIPPAVAEELAGDPAVAAADRRQELGITFRGQTTSLGAGDLRSPPPGARWRCSGADPAGRCWRACTGTAWSAPAPWPAKASPGASGCAWGTAWTCPGTASGTR